ncbi:methyltransferase domain-containing protein [Streptomyces ficellus]|uniref:Methyltransferase domain-containing protein n=1 Tax=Streptomyces ficellus TaxID=1977088 RepID=A0ABT7Z301_9ACTN|nr:class I SAM-dependent methyltransferase [Streptomyces ficellus]MDN3293883.1 methyltransferase domain-containing protein [Streptomyces ficellus]
MSRHQHEHDHTHLDWTEMLPLLEHGAELQAPLYRQAAAWLGELLPAPGVRRILDIGSGPGVISCLLAEAFPYAEVVAVDSTPELLERTRARAASLGGRVTTHHAELPGGIAELGRADLIWAADSLHHLGDQRGALAGLAGQLRPGGLLAVVEGGLPTRRLPHSFGIGRPGLEARIDVAHADWFAEMRAGLPGAKADVDDWRTLLADAGLVPSGTRSFLHDVPAPVTDAVRQQVVAAFTRQRDALGDRLAPEDRATLDRLVDPADPQGLHHRPDVFLLTARTVHTARRG